MLTNVLATILAVIIFEGAQTKLATNSIVHMTEADGAWAKLLHLVLTGWYSAACNLGVDDRGCP